MSKKLKIYTLGEFKVNLSGENITPVDKMNDKPWQLFKYLITERDKNIHPEIIVNELWPTQYVKNPRHTITNLIYRLRNIIGYEDQDGNPYFINCSIACRFNRKCNYILDVDEFIEQCKKANGYKKEDNTDKALECYQDAMDTYKGDYLPEIPYQEWVTQPRYNYHWLFIDNTLEYLNLLKENNEYREIIKTCEDCFEIELFEEKIHLDYIEGLLKLGKYAKARSHYKYASELFNYKLDINEFPKLKTIYEKREIKNGFLTKIKENLDVRDNVKGAFACNNDIFRMMYKLEKRRIERRNKPLILGYIRFQRKDLIDKNINQIENIIIEKLRKGDIVTRWDANQYLILLLDVTKRNAEKVINRVKDTLNKELDIEQNEIAIDYQRVINN